MPTFADLFAERVGAAGSPVCVGLDPVVEQITKLTGTDGIGPGDSDAAAVIERFSIAVLEAIGGPKVVPCIKPQAACFERFGAAGFAALERVCRRARDMGYLVVLDAKRGDIGISAEHYAAMSVHMGAHAVTVSPYLGPDTIEPFLKVAAAGTGGDASENGSGGLGVFVLVRTSNPGSDAVQSTRLADGRNVAEMMADQVAALGANRRGASGLSSVGAVVGATKAADAEAMRRRMPDQIFLIPGYGAQGGTAEDIRRMVRTGATSAANAGVLVTASRSVIYPKVQAGEDWRAAIGRAAREFAAEVRAVVA